METPQEYYRHDGPMTAPGAHAEEFSKLPRDVARLCEIVQGLLIHRDIAPFLYDLKLTEAQREDGHLRPVAQMLTRIHELDSRPIAVARDYGGRLPSVCRHFSLMLSAMLRDHGIPARPRCGFGAYFNAGKFEDHWVCEYWNAAESRWILVDAQMDPVQRKAFKLDFNPLDVPRDRFIIAGDAWQMCRCRACRLCRLRPHACESQRAVVRRGQRDSRPRIAESYGNAAVGRVGNDGYERCGADRGEASSDRSCRGADDCGRSEIRRGAGDLRERRPAASAAGRVQCAAQRAGAFRLLSLLRERRQARVRFSSAHSPRFKICALPIRRRISPTAGGWGRRGGTRGLRHVNVKFVGGWTAVGMHRRRTHRVFHLARVLGELAVGIVHAVELPQHLDEVGLALERELAARSTRPTSAPQSPDACD